MECRNQHRCRIKYLVVDDGVFTVYGLGESVVAGMKPLYPGDDNIKAFNARNFFGLRLKFVRHLSLSLSLSLSLLHHYSYYFFDAGGWTP